MKHLQKKRTTLYLVEGALIAAVYATLTLALAPISFGGNQFRIAEAMTVLPAFTPAAIPGLTIGCLISNLISPYGAVDVVFGTLATLLAALCTRMLRNITVKGIPVLAPLGPIFFNAIIVGAEIACFTTGSFEMAAFSVFIAMAVSVGLGELVVTTALGIPFCIALKKIKFFQKYKI